MGTGGGPGAEKVKGLEKGREAVGGGFPGPGDSVLCITRLLIDTVVADAGLEAFLALSSSAWSVSGIGPHIALEMWVMSPCWDTIAFPQLGQARSPQGLSCSAVNDADGCDFLMWLLTSLKSLLGQRGQGSRLCTPPLRGLALFI